MPVVPPLRETERGSGGEVNPAARNTIAGSALATTARTEGNAAIVPSSSAAAQPITIVCARLALAMWRTKRRNLTSLSLVTVQELTTAISASAGSSTATPPLSSNAWRTRSVSYWLALHPKVWK